MQSIPRDGTSDGGPVTVTVLVPAPVAATARPGTTHPGTTHHPVVHHHPSGPLALTGLGDLLPALAMTAVVLAAALRPRRRRS